MAASEDKGHPTGSRRFLEIERWVGTIHTYSKLSVLVRLSTLLPLLFDRTGNVLGGQYV